MATVWKKVVEQVEVGEDKGDILFPLRRVFLKYMGRTLKHMDAGHPERAAYYQEQAENVSKLINQ